MDLHSPTRLHGVVLCETQDIFTLPLPVVYLYTQSFGSWFYSLLQVTGLNISYTASDAQHSCTDMNWPLSQN